MLPSYPTKSSIPSRQLYICQDCCLLVPSSLRACNSVVCNPIPSLRMIVMPCQVSEEFWLPLGGNVCCRDFKLNHCAPVIICESGKRATIENANCSMQLNPTAPSEKHWYLVEKSWRESQCFIFTSYARICASQSVATRLGFWPLAQFGRGMPSGHSQLKGSVHENELLSLKVIRTMICLPGRHIGFSSPSRDCLYDQVHDLIHPNTHMPHLTV